MATVIQIKRTTGTSAPTTTDLAEGELAYVQDRTNDGASSKLYIESVDSLSSEVVHEVGGKFFTDIINGATVTPANFKVGNGATSGAQIELYEDSDNGTNYTGFKSPDALAGDVIYTLPLTDGNDGQQLQTNGTGTLSWQNSTATIAGADDTDVSSEASGQLLIWDGTDSWDNVDVTGDVTITNLGVTTLGAGTVEFTMFDAATVQTSAELVTPGFSDDDVTVLTAAAVQDRIDTTNNAQDLDITDGTTTSQVLIDSQTMTVQGTANEVTVGLSGQTFTVGLPDSVSITTELTAASAIVSDLTDNRITIAGTSGALEDDANLTFDGTNFQVGGTNFSVAQATGNTSIAGTLDVDTSATLASVNVEDLTDNRVVIAGASGELEDDANLTFDGTDFVIGGASGVSIKGSGTDVGDVNIASGNFTIDASTGDVVVGGNLTVSGTTTTVDSTTVSIADPVFEIGESDTDDNLDRGIKFLYNDGAAKIGFFGYDDSTGKFIALSDATDATSTFSGTALPAVFGNLEVSDINSGSGNFQVTASNGNTTIAGTLDATGSFAINTNQFTVDGSNGNTLIAGTVSLSSSIVAVDGVAPTSGQLLIGHGTNGDLQLATLTEGSNGVTITNGDASITIENDLATTSTVGVASFSADNFTVTTGDVTITAIDGGTYS